MRARQSQMGTRCCYCRCCCGQFGQYLLLNSNWSTTMRTDWIWIIECTEFAHIKIAICQFCHSSSWENVVQLFLLCAHEMGFCIDDSILIIGKCIFQAFRLSCSGTVQSHWMWRNEKLTSYCHCLMIAIQSIEFEARKLFDGHRVISLNCWWIWLRISNVLFFLSILMHLQMG